MGVFAMAKIWLQYDLQCNYRLRSTSFILYIFWHLLLLHKLSLLFIYDKSSSNIKQLVFLSLALWTTFFGIQFKNVSKTKKRRTFWHNLFHAIILFLFSITRICFVNMDILWTIMSYRHYLMVFDISSGTRGSLCEIYLESLTPETKGMIYLRASSLEWIKIRTIHSRHRTTTNIFSTINFVFNSELFLVQNKHCLNWADSENFSWSIC